MTEHSDEKKGLGKRKTMILLAGLAGAVLLIFGSLGWKDGKNSTSAVGEEISPDASAYAASVEEEIRAICARVKGAGSVSVAVTLKGGYRAVYATDSQSGSGGYKNHTVLIGSGSSEGAVLICYENPEISGVGIVCRGATDPTVRDTIISLVSAAFDVKSNKIYVAVGGES